MTYLYLKLCNKISFSFFLSFFLSCFLDVLLAFVFKFPRQESFNNESASDSPKKDGKKKIGDHYELREEIGE